MKKISKEIRFFESIVSTLVDDLQEPDRDKVLRAIETLAAHSTHATQALPMLHKLTASGVDRHVTRVAKIAIEKIVGNAEIAALG